MRRMEIRKKKRDIKALIASFGVMYSITFLLFWTLTKLIACYDPKSTNLPPCDEYQAHTWPYSCDGNLPKDAGKER